MKSLFSCAIIAVIAAILLSTQLAAAGEVAGCHNATGSCAKHGFVCANDEVVPHAKRCDGVEDCADGTDEYMCNQAPKPVFELSPSERNAVVESGCVFCNCLKGTITIGSGNTAWFKIALDSPRDWQMMTDAPAQFNRPCNPAQVTSIRLAVYKKNNKGCRGWVCCFRQNACMACSGGFTTASHCWV